MKKLLTTIFLSAGFSMSLAATTWNPDNRLLDAVCQIESSGGRYVYGDGGRSLGPFQIQKAAWSDVSMWRKKRSLPIYDYRQDVLNPQINRIYAANYITIIYERLQNQYKRDPRPSEIYAAYNMGLNSFRKCNYDLTRINPVTAGKCRRLEAWLE